MGKGNLLVSSNFSFYHSVFKRHVLQTHKNRGFFGKGLTCQNWKPLQTSHCYSKHIFLSSHCVKNIVKKGENAGYQIFPLLYETRSTLSQTTNFRLNEFADDNNRFDKNDGKFSERKHILSKSPFSSGLFNRPVLQTLKSKGLFWKEFKRNTGWKMITPVYQ